MNRWMGVMVVISAAACSDTKDIELDVDQSGEETTLSWDLGDATLVTVSRCPEDSCECEYMAPLVGAQQLLEGEGEVVWKVGFEFDPDTDDLATIDEVNQDPGLVSSPLTYGDPEVPGDRLHFEPLPLESGERYGVVVNILGPCDGDEKGCSHVDASGCSIFEAE